MNTDEIRGRLDATTPGPWHLDADGDRGVYTERRASDTSRDVASAFERNDEVFIAHAPEDMRRLLAAVEAVEGWMQNLDAVERAKPTDPNDLNCSARDVARNVRAAIRAALEAS